VGETIGIGGTGKQRARMCELQVHLLNLLCCIDHRGATPMYKRRDHNGHEPLMFYRLGQMSSSCSGPSISMMVSHHRTFCMCLPLDTGSHTSRNT
jgi:hypothetical protein